MKENLKNELCAILLLAATVTPVVAKADDSPHLFRDEKLTLDDPFRRGNFEAVLTAGPFFSPIGSPLHRPAVNYAVGSLQLGYMINQPSTNAGFLRGNFEVALEGFGAAIFLGPGNYVAGETLWLRYNFVQPGWRLVPFAEIGAGFVLTDTDRYLVGQNFNFNLDIGAGTRYLVTRHCSVNLECRFQHISNANSGPKNVGINSVGPFLGVSWFF